MNDGTVVSGGTTVLSSMRQQSLNTAALDWGGRERWRDAGLVLIHTMTQFFPM